MYSTFKYSEICAASMCRECLKLAKQPQQEKQKKQKRLLKLALWNTVLSYKDIREFIYRLLGDDDIVVTIESMRTTYEPQIRKLLAVEQQRKAMKSARRREKKNLKKSKTFTGNERKAISVSK